MIMIMNTGSRTDIPAFFNNWFMNRIRAGYVCVRNPYNPLQVSRYRLDPEVVDLLSFCTKNPGPMLPHIDEIRNFRQFWHVTITPYGRDIEPNVPDSSEVIKSFRALSEMVGSQAMSWRYDPVFISDEYSLEYHKRAFAEMAQALAGSTRQCVVSFIDLYEKTKRNFPEVRAVTKPEQQDLIESFAETAGMYGMQIHLCLEDRDLVREHVDADGCFGQAVIEEAIGTHLQVPRKKPAREGCNCLLGADIGAYNTCLHGCRYCYANYDQALVEANFRRHDPESDFLIGGYEPGDIVHDVEQKSWIDGQMTIFDLWGGDWETE